MDTRPSFKVLTSADVALGTLTDEELDYKRYSEGIVLTGKTQRLGAQPHINVLVRRPSSPLPPHASALQRM
jgi:hypothetical protein